MRRVITWRSLVVAVASLSLLGLLSVAAQGSTSAATNGKIAFARWSGDDVQCFTINPDGTNEAETRVCSAWSPDGSRICGGVDVEGEVSRPAISNPDGSGFTLLDAYPGLQRRLGCDDWAPDGSRFLSASAEDDVPADDGLRTLRASDGGDQLQITAPPLGYEDFPIGYSPDGSRVLFNRVSDDNPHVLFSVNPDGSGLLQLSPSELSVIDNEFFDRVSADWSPDGSRVTFAAVWKASNGNGRGTALFVVDGDGSHLRQITPSGVGAVSAQWSPNGRLIAFTSKYRADEQIWIVRPDGTGLKELTSGSDGSTSRTPIWSPDGTKLLLQRENRLGERALWTVNVDGTGLTKVTDIPNFASYAWGTAPSS